MKHLFLALAAVIVMVATFTIQRSASASPGECKGLKKWDYSTTYKKGDDVYLSSSGYDNKWECTAASCAKDYPDSVPGLKSWKDLGRCSARVQ